MFYKIFEFLRLCKVKFYIECPYSQETIDEHLSTRCQTEVARDFIDVYMDEMEEQLKANASITFSSNILDYT